LLGEAPVPADEPVAGGTRGNIDAAPPPIPAAPPPIPAAPPPTAGATAGATAAGWGGAWRCGEVGCSGSGGGMVGMWSAMGVGGIRRSASHASTSLATWEVRGQSLSHRMYS
jgi:hypothetical protein